MVGNSGTHPFNRTVAGPAEVVCLFWTKIKITFHFLQKQVINKNTSVIIGLVRLIILSK